MAIGKITLVEPAELERGAQGFNTAEAALQAVLGRGFHLPTAPNGGYQGTLPTNLTALDDTRLGDLLNEVSIWCSYAEIELSKAEALLNDVEKRLDFMKSRIRIGLRVLSEKKLTNSDKDDEVTSDPRILAEEEKLAYFAALHGYMKVLVRNGQRDWDTVSRRITQRGQEIERMTRESNVGGIPVHSRTFNR